MFHFLFQRRFAAALSSALLTIMMLSVSMFSGTAFARPAATTLTVVRIWTTDENGNTKTIFAPGDAIQYYSIVNNSSGSSITASFHYEAFSGQTKIYDHIFQNSPVSVGTITYPVPSTVPNNAPSGTYTIRVTVTDQNSSNSAVNVGQFTVNSKQEQPPSTIKPGGLWVYPADGLTFVKGSKYTIIARGYQTNPSDPAIAYVNVTGYWNNTWHVICHIPNDRPDLGDHYYCSTNFQTDGNYPPEGQLTLSFDVYDVAGNKNLSPNGEHTGTFSSTATTLSTSENILDQLAMPVLSSSGHKISEAGETAQSLILVGSCVVEVFGKGIAKLPGKLGHAGKIIVKFYKIYDTGNSASAIALDTVTGQYWEVFIELAHAFNPIDSCTTIIQTDVQILYFSLQGLVKP